MEKIQILTQDNIQKYQPSLMPNEIKKELRDITTRAANKAGMKKLPELPKE